MIKNRHRVFTKVSHVTDSFQTRKKKHRLRFQSHIITLCISYREYNSLLFYNFVSSSCCLSFSIYLFLSVSVSFNVFIYVCTCLSDPFYIKIKNIYIKNVFTTFLKWKDEYVYKCLLSIFMWEFQMVLADFLLPGSVRRKWYGSDQTPHHWFYFMSLDINITRLPIERQKEYCLLFRWRAGRNHNLATLKHGIRTHIAYTFLK